MARGKVFLQLPGRDECETWEWKTDLTGHGSVGIGEEFIAREMIFGRLEGGRKLRVGVVAVHKRAIGNADIIQVEILADLTPPPKVEGDLFSER